MAPRWEAEQSPRKTNILFRKISTRLFSSDERQMSSNLDSCKGKHFGTRNSKCNKYSKPLRVENEDLALSLPATRDPHSSLHLRTRKLTRWSGSCRGDLATRKRNQLYNYIISCLDITSNTQSNSCLPATWTRNYCRPIDVPQNYSQP